MPEFWNKSGLKEQSRPVWLLAMLRAFLAVFAVMISFGLSGRNPVLPLLFGLLTVELARNDGKRFRIGASEILAGVFALTVLFAKHKEIEAEFDSRLFVALSLLILVLGWFVMAQLVFGAMLAWLDRAACGPVSAITQATDAGQKSDTQGQPGQTSFFEKHIQLLTMGILFLLYLPYYLYEFPGILSPDSINQAGQAFGLYTWSNHHPIAHTLLIQAACKVMSLLTPDRNLQIGFYTLLQMSFLVYCFGYSVKTLQRLGAGLRYCILAILFYAVLPFQGVFSVTVWKDVPFAGVVLLLTCEIATWVFAGEHGLWRYLRYGILVFAMCLLRSNGFYACILLVPLLERLFYDKSAGAKEKGGRKFFSTWIAVAGLTALIFAGILRGPVIEALHIYNGDFIESMPIPLQQVTRVIVDGKTVPEADLHEIHQVIDTTYINQLYAPDFADNMKELVRAGNQGYLTGHKGTFLSIWLRWGLRYPGIYLQSWVDMTRGYWYPDYDMDVASITGVIDNDLGLYSRHLIGGPLIVKWRELGTKLAGFIPMYGLLWSIGSYVWLQLVILAWILKRRDGSGERDSENGHPASRCLLAILLPSMTALLTILIATPATDFRYAYSLVVTLPIWFGIPWMKNVSKET